MKTVLYFLLTAAALRSQQIAGKVVNSVNGEPVRRAIVIVRSQDADHGLSYAAETDSHGQFVVKAMEPGSYMVSADRQGFHFQAGGATGAPPPPLKLDRDQQVQELVLRLIPTGVIAGRVLDEEGDPVRGASVQALTSNYVNGKKQLGQVSQVTCNDKGEYRLFGLVPGTFYIQASADNMRMHGERFDMPIRGQHPPEHPTPTYFPSVSDAARAVPIEVAAGAELRGFDVRLRRERAYSVRFKLPANPSGNHYYSAQVTDGANTPRYGARWTSDVMEVPGLPPGSYVVTITQTEGNEQSFARVPFEIVDADVDGGTPAFSPGIDLTGTVSADDKKPHPWENIRVSLRSDASGPYNSPGSAVSADGTFTLHHVPPDTYRLTVQLIRAVPDTYVKSASIGDHELVDWMFDLTRENGVLHIQLGTDVATIEGSVKNAAGDPAVRARVNLIPYGNSAGRTDQTKFTFTDEKGEFNFKGVAPALYRVFAWEDVELGRPQDPVFRKRFENQSALVRMASNGHEKVELTAITAAAARKPEP